MPDLILLDLNLPKWDGREVLKKVKTDDKLKHIPIIVLTTSNAEKDVINCYNLHANCFITKPVDYENFFQIIRHIEIFWLDTITGQNFSLFQILNLTNRYILRSLYGRKKKRLVI